ncbi:hypothetical protein D3C84_1083380 [compost metagenome]
MGYAWEPISVAREVGGYLRHEVFTRYEDGQGPISASLQQAAYAAEHHSLEVKVQLAFPGGIGLHRDVVVGLAFINPIH